MKSQNRWYSIISLIIVACLLAVPVSAFGKKGKDHYDRGMKYEQAQQWEKAAQEFTLAVAADPSNVDYQLHYRRAVFNASQMFMQPGRKRPKAVERLPHPELPVSRNLRLRYDKKKCG